MAQTSVSPVVLVILDGWGYRETKDGNAIAAAKKPVMDSLWEVYPRTPIRTSGRAVGLPNGQMGNSEVGHLNIGAGRVVPQELVRISDAVEDGSLLSNAALVELCSEVRSRGGKLHLTGLCSEGGVHSHLSHIWGLLQLAKAQEISEVCIHAITDGRDTNPKEGVEALAKIESYIEKVGVGRIATLSGRYYAMDRDKRWDRVRRAYEMMVTEVAPDGRSAIEVLQA
jgi:2,3-bisphosphoglycerate-independent phosphoglycerate mutase